MKLKPDGPRILAFFVLILILFHPSKVWAETTAGALVPKVPQIQVLPTGKPSQPASPQVAVVVSPLPSDKSETGLPQPHLSMPDNVPRPLRVGVSIMINSLTKLNDLAGNYEANLDLQLRWQDPNQAFDPEKVGVDRQEFGYEAAEAKLATMWTPTVQFSNLIDKPLKWEPGLFIQADGTVTYVQRIKAVFDARLKLAAFPFDRQTLTLLLQTPRESVGQVVLSQDQQDLDASGFQPNMNINGWKLNRQMDFSASTFRGWNGGFYSQMEASIKLARIPANHVPIIFIPYFLLMLVPTVMTLYAKADLAPRLTAWSGAILALVALNFTFSIRFPALGSDTFMGELIAIGFGYQLLMVTLSATVFNTHLTKVLGGEDLIAELVVFLRWGIPCTFFGLLISRILLTMYA